jgi:hypothetical protein
MMEEIIMIEMMTTIKVVAKEYEKDVLKSFESEKRKKDERETEEALSLLDSFFYTLLSCSVAFNEYCVGILDEMKQCTKGTFHSRYFNKFLINMSS